MLQYMQWTTQDGRTYEAPPYRIVIQRTALNEDFYVLKFVNKHGSTYDIGTPTSKLTAAMNRAVGHASELESQSNVSSVTAQNLDAYRLKYNALLAQCENVSKELASAKAALTAANARIAALEEKSAEPSPCGLEIRLRALEESVWNHINPTTCHSCTGTPETCTCDKGADGDVCPDCNCALRFCECED